MPADLDPLYYERIGKDFGRFMSDYDVSRRIDLIRRLINGPIDRNTSILEVGCGTGRISRYLATLTDNLTVNDISEKLAISVSGDLNCQTLFGDCAYFINQGKKFDLIVSSECLEHCLHPFKALSGIARLLKKNGRLIMTTPNSLWHPLVALTTILKIRKFQGIENWVWPNQVRKWLKRNGFEDIRFSGCHLFPWQIPMATKILPVFDQAGDILYPVMINFGFSAKKIKNCT